jgi:hypothetical protein
MWTRHRSKTIAWRLSSNGDLRVAKSTSAWTPVGGLKGMMNQLVWVSEDAQNIVCSATVENSRLAWRIDAS